MRLKDAYLQRVLKRLIKLVSNMPLQMQHVPLHVGDAAVDLKSVSSLLAVLAGESMAYGVATRSAACGVLSAAAYCEENVSVMMHAGAGRGLCLSSPYD